MNSKLTVFVELLKAAGYGAGLGLLILLGVAAAFVVALLIIAACAAVYMKFGPPAIILFLVAFWLLGCAAGEAYARYLEL